MSVTNLNEFLCALYFTTSCDSKQQLFGSVPKKRVTDAYLVAVKHFFTEETAEGLESILIYSYD